MTLCAISDQSAAEQNKRGLASRGSSAFAYSAFIDGCDFAYEKCSTGPSPVEQVLERLSRRQIGCGAIQGSMTVQ